MSNKLKIKEIRDLIPSECFNKCLKTSMYYMMRDILLIASSIFVFNIFNYNWITLIIYWNIYGFFMWCLFVVGHDCGHSSFSNYPIINDLCGNICHSILLVPYWPWALSHKKHHQNHNHIENDKSHPWLKEEKINDMNFIEKFIFNYITGSFIGPISFALFGYGSYLYYGASDGSHIFPFSDLYKNSSIKDRIKCVISTFLCLIFLFSLYIYTGSIKMLFLFYGGPWFIFCSWLFIVTYMQHHKEETIIFDDSNWSYLDGALETIDRNFNYGIDNFHHNITDCHIVHHLFFTQIPHYHLKKATESIKDFLIEKKCYNLIDHKFFPLDYYKLFYNVNYIKWSIKK